MMWMLNSFKQKALFTQPVKTLLPGIIIGVILNASLVTASEWVDIPSGSFLMGSTAAQIEKAYQISHQGYGHDGVRDAHWFDHESPQRREYLQSYQIMKTQVTQAEYASFIQATQHEPPFVSPEQWADYHLNHPYKHVKPYLWIQGRYPKDKGQHPVVMVNMADIKAYASWLSTETGQRLRLPSHAEWEKAMRGQDGALFPWGDDYHADYLNNADHGPYGTMPVGLFPQGSSSYGILDAAGQVFEWTATKSDNGERYIVKGGSWDDHGGVCRPAAFHTRPASLKHILIGFRLVRDNF